MACFRIELNNHVLTFSIHRSCGSRSRTYTDGFKGRRPTIRRFRNRIESRVMESNHHLPPYEGGAFLGTQQSVSAECHVRATRLKLTRVKRLPTFRSEGRITGSSYPCASYTTVG
jgi:hypothetical protein